MTRVWLWVSLLTLMGSGAVQAASYVDIHGVVHDPIQSVLGGNLESYTGDNLTPNMWRTGSDLRYADLNQADLSGMNFTNSDFRHANLSGAAMTNIWLPDAILQNVNLSNANLSGGYLYYASLSLSDLTGANLTNADVESASLYSVSLLSANLAGISNWSTATWTGATYSLNATDNSGNPIPDTVFPTGMDQAWRDAAGMVAVPEPTTALLVGLGLMGLGVRRRVR